MGQNQSYPENSSTVNNGDSDTGNNNNNNQTSGASETSNDASTREGGDKRTGAISQAQSVRAAIDTLIESCLVAKDDGMNGETVKAPTVGYSLEQLSNLKDDSRTDETSSVSEEKKSSKKEPTEDKEESCASKEKEDDSSPKTFGSLMEKSIIELIKKGDDDSDDMALIGSLNDKPSEVSGKNDSSSEKNSSNEQQGKSSAGDKSVGKPAQTKSPASLQKRTVRLQTLIDTVLDNSLAHDMPSLFEKRKNEALINDLLIGRCENEAKNAASPKPSPSKSMKTSAASDTKESKMIYFMDHIEKVLEKNFEASNRESEDDSSLHILNRLLWESPPTSSSAPAQNMDTAPKTKQSENQSRSSSGSNSSEGTISVQDIVDRVISQTEVISKLLSPSDAAASRAGKDLCKTSTSSSTSSLQTATQVTSKSMEQSRSPQSRPSSGSHLVEGHSSKVGEYSNSRGRPRASTYDNHQMWNLRHAQDARTAMSRSAEKNPQEYRQLDVATSGGEGLHAMSKPGKSVPSPNFGSGPLVLPPYMNSLAPTSGILSFAQSPVFRPPGHQVFMPRYPVPLLRVDLPSDGHQSLPPHPPNASCACVACVSKFRMEEHSPKHGLLGPVSPSSGMLSPHGQVDSSYYQQRLASQMHTSGPGQHSPYMMREYNRPRSNSPGRIPMPGAPQMPAGSSKQGLGQSQKTVHYPPPAVPLGGYPREVAEFHDYTSYEKQKLEMMKSERGGYRSQHMQQISIQNPFETPRPEVYSAVDHNMHMGRLEPGLQSSEEHGRAGSSYEHLADKRLHSLPSRVSPAQAVPHDEPRRERAPVSSQILDLTVKNETRAHADSVPSRPNPVEESADQPLDLSKKSTAPSFGNGNDHFKRQQIHTPKAEPIGFRKPDIGMKQEGNSKPAHHHPMVDGSIRYSHPQQREVHPYPGVGPSAFSINPRVPGPAEMAPTVNPNMLLSTGGQRPQLHPLPAPSLATSLMPTSSSAAMLQTYMPHTGAALPNHSLPSVLDHREKLAISGQQQKSKSAEPVIKPQRESPQLDSPDNLEKGDLTGRRNCAGRNEPIQSIIGNHNPNDILYLICRICRQSNGSPYAFRKHFRNHHGFEPKAEHTIVQTISATKSARQNPYSSSGPDGECVPEPVPNTEERNSVERSQSQGSSESYSLESSTQNETSSKSKNYGRGGEGKQSSTKENREDTKYLECPECKQTFQLNDFGSYKRHCRQHNQSRSSGSFVSPELSESQDPVDKLQGGITMCKICGVPFSVHYIEDHIRSVHGYFCSQCPDVFKTSDELQSHVRSTHSSNLLPVAASPGVPASSPGVRLSPRIHSPSHASLPSHSPNSPHHRSPSRSEPSMSTPSPGSAGQTKTKRDTRSSPSEASLCIPSTKPGAVVLGRVSSATENSSNYGSISSTCEIERMPADNLTISASPDSSSDNVTKSSLSVSVVSDITISCSLTSRDASVSSIKTNKSKGDDDMDSTISGSPSDMIIDMPPANGDVQNFFYKHKKFGGHRKRAESSDGSEVSAKVMKHGKDDSASGQNVNEDSSNSSCSSYKSNDGEKTEDRVVAKDQGSPVVQTKSKVDSKVKQEARHQLPFVWDRVTRIQAGKNIKPPDYMT